MSQTTHSHRPRFAFFGTRPLAAGVLDELERAGFVPERVIDTPAVPPERIEELARAQWDVFIVASFGAILPRAILEMPRRGVLNVHPSLLPRLRGPSPIRSAILQGDEEFGVSLMLLDDQMDHGPLLAQRKVTVKELPPHGKALDERLAREGGKLLAEMLPLWLEDRIEARPQNHDLATYCRRFKKEDGLLDLEVDARENLRKIRAFEGWPGTYAFFERPSIRSGQAPKRLRVQILDAHLEGGKLAIDRVKPEGKGEMSYEAFLRSGARYWPGS